MLVFPLNIVELLVELCSTSLQKSSDRRYVPGGKRTSKLPVQKDPVRSVECERRRNMSDSEFEEVVRIMRKRSVALMTAVVNFGAVETSMFSELRGAPEIMGVF
jgi:hypothetical protein